MRSLYYIVVILFALSCCAKKDAGGIDKKEDNSISIGKVTSIRTKPGRNRLELSWREPANLGDVKLAKYRVYWNNMKDSLEVPVPASVDSVLVLMKDLEEGNYVFSIFAYDNKGNRSSSVSTIGRTYDVKYEAELVNRLVKNAFYDKEKGSVEIIWDLGISAGAIASEIRYMDKTDQARVIVVKTNETRTSLEDFKVGSEISYRTLFMPQNDALDTFTTGYGPVQLQAEEPEEIYGSMVFLDADGPGDTYELLGRVLGGSPEETPDCRHPEFGRHIAEEFNTELNKNVFSFFAHVAFDDDRCGAIDRQRTEIKTYGPSRSSVKGLNGDEMIFKWKFRLDAKFQPSTGFTHIHQIKAGDGTNEGSPLITITPRYGSSSDKLEIIHTGNTDAASKGKVIEVLLAPFKGTWVEVTEKVKFGTHGTFSIVIKRVSDGFVLLNYSSNDMDLWRSEATFMRPKWGIYRSLGNAVRLRDEKVLFADFAIGKK